MSTTAVPMPTCPYCGSLPHDHIGQCPMVKSVEYFPDGTIKRVEKHSLQQSVHLSADDLWDLKQGRDR